MCCKYFNVAVILTYSVKEDISGEINCRIGVKIMSRPFWSGLQSCTCCRSTFHLFLYQLGVYEISESFFIRKCMFYTNCTNAGLAAYHVKCKCFCMLCLGMEFFETSAKENVNVKMVFERLVDIICDKMSESLDVSDGAASNGTGGGTKRLTDKNPTGGQNSGCQC